MVADTVRWRIINARIGDEHVHMGFTRRGTPVGLDRRFLEAELKIVTGLVEPHSCGYPGRKVISRDCPLADDHDDPQRPLPRARAGGELRHGG